MSSGGHASSLSWEKILRERDRLGGDCLVTGGEFVLGEIVCGVMQNIAVRAVCYFFPVLN